MTEEKTTVTGRVASVTPWKSKKGAWVNLDDNPNDFFAYKGCVPEEGEHGTWEVKMGERHLADKTCLAKKVGGTDLKEKVEVKAKEEVKDMEDIIAKGDKVYFDKQELIVKQCCIKAAAQIVGRVVGTDSNWKIAKLAEATVDLADRFYCYICRGEGPEDKEPEDD